MGMFHAHIHIAQQNKYTTKKKILVKGTGKGKAYRSQNVPPEITYLVKGPEPSPSVKSTASQC